MLLFGQDARSSKSNFVGCFDPKCHVASIVTGKLVLELFLDFTAFLWFTSPTFLGKLHMLCTRAKSRHQAQAKFFLDAGFFKIAVRFG